MNIRIAPKQGWSEKVKSVSSTKKADSTRVDLMEHQLKELVKRRMQDEISKIDHTSSIEDLRSVLGLELENGSLDQDAIKIQNFY